MFATSTDRGNNLHRKVSIQKRLQNDKENIIYVLWQQCHKTKSQAKPMQTAYGLVHGGDGATSHHPTTPHTLPPPKTQPNQGD